MAETKKTYSEKLRDPRWQKKRLFILNRDEFTCQWCQDKESTLHIHHLKYKGEPWEVEDEFLITLCENCHQCIDENYQGAAARLIAALRSKAFAAEHLIKLAKAIENSPLTGIPFEPTTDTIAHIFRDEVSFDFIRERYFKWVHENLKLEINGN